MKYFKEKSVIRDGANTRDADMSFQGQIVVGKFVDRSRPTWMEAMNEHYGQFFGDRYKTYGGLHAEN